MQLKLQLTHIFLFETVAEFYTVFKNLLKFRQDNNIRMPIIPLSECQKVGETGAVEGENTLSDSAASSDAYALR